MRRSRTERASARPQHAETRPPLGGNLRPLTRSKAGQITDAAFAILETIGLSGATPEILSLAMENGGKRRADGRLVIPRALAEDMIAKACERVELPGYKRRRGIEVGGRRVHIGTGGAAVQVLDAAAGGFRDGCGPFSLVMRLVRCKPSNRGSRASACFRGSI